MLLIIGAFVILLGWIYIFFVRDYLVAKYPLYGKFDEFERTLFDKSRTILMSRLYWIGGLLVGVQSLAASAGLDVTPVIQELAKWIPEGYRGLAVSGFLFVTGVIFEWLRKKTTAPVGQEPTE